MASGFNEDLSFSFSSSESTAEAHILFDEGAQRSFISQKLADELQLKPTGTDTVHVASFGQNSQSVRYLQTAKVHLITDRNEKIAIHVLIVPTIAVPLCNIQQEVSTLKYLHGLKLAHPVTTENSFDISLLIGADSYWKIVQNRVVTVADPGPLMLGVLDRWTPTVNVLHTLIAQISFRIELCPIEARGSISLYITHLSIWPSSFRYFFSFYFVLKKQMSPASDQFGSQVRDWVNLYRKQKTLNFATY